LFVFKGKEAKIIQKFRLISLVDCEYKIISNFLANRLTHIISHLVDPTQTIFIQGRYILDNVLAAHEIIHYSEIHKEKYIVLKVDFDKAYDNVNWNFIREMLIRRGFGNKWVTWIMNLLHGAQTYININGITTQFFQCKRGLRQGDPLSPFFLLSH
jgi:Reverse transcriptase (RNA-dependent DNA polymerase)